MFKLVISFIISVQAISYYQDTADAASNSTFNLANDYFCFCDLHKNVSDLNCCCDPDKTVTNDDQSCLVGSLKKSCFKQYIIFNQNVDKWVEVQKDSDKHELCLLYDANQAVSTYIATLTSLDTKFYQDYMFNQFIPQYKPMKLDQKIVNNSWLERTQREFYLYPDSNGICKLIKQRIDHKPMKKIRCTYTYTTSCAVADFLGSTEAPTYVDDGNYVYSVSANTDGCIDNIRYEYAYDSLVSGINPNYISTDLYRKSLKIYINIQTSYPSGLNRYKSISSEVIFYNSLTNQFYNGQEGYKFGQNVPGSLANVAFTKLGLPIYRGKQNYEVDCSVYNSSNTFLDPRSYETLQFGQNVQYSCRKQMTIAECSTTTLDSLQLFHSFPIGNGTVRISKKPLYATSLPASDMVFSTQIAAPQISTTTTSCTLQTTQLVLIYYDEYGYQGSRQKYIQSVQVGYKDLRVIADQSEVYFRVVVKFIQLTYDEIENSLPQDPSFIPQLPSDIFFPIWYESWGMVPQMMILLLFCNY